MTNAQHTHTHDTHTLPDDTPSGTHFHVYGYWSEDTDDYGVSLTFWEMVSEVASRADLFADFHTDTAHGYGDFGDTLAQTSEDRANYWYAQAWHASRMADKYGNLHVNARRFDEWARGVRDLPGGFTDFTDARLQDSARFSVGLIAGNNGYWVDTLDISVETCTDPTCEAWEEICDTWWEEM